MRACWSVELLPLIGCERTSHAPPPFRRSTEWQLEAEQRLEFIALCCAVKSVYHRTDRNLFLCNGCIQSNYLSLTRVY